MDKNKFSIIFWSFIFLLIDQLIKFITSANMILNQSNIVIRNFFSITLVHNTGAAFSILSGRSIFLIIIGILVTTGLIIYIIRQNNLKEIDIFKYSLLLGGIMGNLIDRIIHGYVIDYLSFNFGSYYFPIFNFADVCIIISVVIIFIMSLKEEIWKSQ